MKTGFIKIDKQMAKDIIHEAGESMYQLSAEMGFSHSWLAKSIDNGSLKLEDLMALEDRGIDLTPAIKEVTAKSWITKTDIGRIFAAIILKDEGMSVQGIADKLGIDWKTATRYLRTWEYNRFGIDPEQLKKMYEIARREK